jgi:hypothetical protein
MDLLLLRAYVSAQSHLVSTRARSQRGQATTEYVLVLLGVAAIAIAVGAWAARSGKVGDLLDKVFDNLADQVE